MVEEHQLLIDGDGAVFDFSYADTAHIFVVIDGTDQYLGVCLGIAFGSGDIFENGLKQWLHVLRGILEIEDCVPGLGRCVEERTVELFVRSIQIHEKFENLVDDFFGAGLRTVDLVDAYDYMQIEFQGFFKHKFCLRHGTFEGIHKKDDTVHHLEHSLDFAAEVRMARGIDYVDLDTFIMYRCIFGKNGDSSFPLDIVGVHDSFLNFLILAKNAALLKQLVDQRGLAVVDMGDNSYVSDIFTFDLHLYFSVPPSSKGGKSS